MKITIDDIRLNSNLTTNKTDKFTKKSFFSTTLGFTHSHSGELGDIERFVQLIPGTYTSNKPINITGIDKVHLECDCINGSIVNGLRVPVLYSFVLSSPPGRKIYKDPRVKLFKKINKHALSHITFYLDDDDHKLVVFSNKTRNFTCQLIKIYYSYLYTYQCKSIYIRGIHKIIFVFISEIYLDIYLY